MNYNGEKCLYVEGSVDDAEITLLKGIRGPVFDMSLLWVFLFRWAYVRLM